MNYCNEKLERYYSQHAAQPSKKYYYIAIGSGNMGYFLVKKMGISLGNALTEGKQEEREYVLMTSEHYEGKVCWETS